MQQRPTVVVDQPVADEVEQYIAQHCRYKIWREQEPAPAEIIDDWLADADGLLLSSRTVDAALLERAPKLKAVSTISVGYNHLDINALRARGIVGTHTPNVLNETVADLVFALMLCTARRIAELDSYVKSGRWDSLIGSDYFGTDVHHKTLGIIGMGRIGEAIVRRARFGFSMEVLYYSRSRKPEAEKELGVVYRPMDELLAAADFVVLMTPLTPETVGLMGREQFARMKRSAIFINGSRGPTVDEAALVEALRQGTILAAGLDVYEREPIAADHPLLRMPNVVTLPHVGSATAQTRKEMAMLAARNMVDALYGRTPPNVVSELK